LVTVVIPCYNQARFLGEGIESALSQTYKNFEVVVVDDGSDDHTSEVAARYGRVRLVRQENKGLSAARNRGFAEGRGEYVVFLDADDRLLPDALEVGVGKLETHPNCAFVSGHCTLIAVDGSALQTPHQFHVRKAHYRALLRGNYIWNPASVIYRRTVLDSIGGFDTSVGPTADYDLYLRIAKDYPVYCHERVVVEARRHGANMSSDYERMLKYSLIVLESQWRYARGDGCDEEAYRQGINHYRKYYGGLARRQDVSWWTGDGSEGQVYVSECRGIADDTPLADEHEAIAHLETLRTRGGEFLLIPAASYWWLGRYARLRRHLQEHYPVAFEGEDTCLIFDLRDKKAADR
jgi:glycosyltransferase involved in cell wall biosynthesis